MTLPAKGVLGDLNILRNDFADEIENQRDQIAFLGTLWEPTTPYVHPCRTRGSNGTLYDSKQSSTGQDPTLDTAMAYWAPQKSFSFPGDDVNLSYEPTAQQMLERRLLERNGASILRSDYPELFAAIGTIYGAVDISHFNLPDDRGLFIRIWDHGAGVDPDAASRTDRGDGVTGDEVGTLENDAMQGHRHSSRSEGSAGGAGTAYDAMRTGEGFSSDDDLIGNPTTDNVHGNPRISSETRPINRYKWGGIFY